MWDKKRENSWYCVANNALSLNYWQRWAVRGEIVKQWYFTKWKCLYVSLSIILIVYDFECAFIFRSPLTHIFLLFVFDLFLFYCFHWFSFVFSLYKIVNIPDPAQSENETNRRSEDKCEKAEFEIVVDSSSPMNQFVVEMISSKTEPLKESSTLTSQNEDNCIPFSSSLSLSLYLTFSY